MRRVTVAWTGMILFLSVTTLVVFGHDHPIDALWIFQQGWLFAVLLVLIGDTLFCWLLATAYQGRFARSQWFVVKIGDIFVLPVLFGLLAKCISYGGYGSGFYTSDVWYGALLALIGISYFVKEVNSFYDPYIQRQNVITPNNLYHDYIFVVLAWGIACAIIPALRSAAPLWLKALTIVVGACFAVIIYIDGLHFAARKEAGIAHQSY